MEKRRRTTLLVAIAAAAAIVCTSLFAWTAGNDGFESPVRLPFSASDDIRQIDWDEYPDSIVAWVEVPGTSVDEPVAQASESDPNAYLTVDALGQGAYGTPYLDWECSAHSPFAVVYGHHMSDGTVFADLAEYSDESYARKHRCVYLYTRDDDRRHEYEVVAADVVNAWNETIQVSFEDDEKRKAYLADAVGGSDIVIGELQEGSNVLALVTCSYQTSNSRTVVYAVETGGGR